MRQIKTMMVFLALATITGSAWGAIFEGKKVLFINSYHKGYEWSDGIELGVRQGLEGSGVQLITFQMDSKNNADEDFIKRMALEVKALIERTKPDVVISADDNAFKYVIQPFYKGEEIPVVFCGLNWDASVYGAPYKNTTGMVEVSLIESLINNLKQFTKGKRIGYLSSDTLSEHKDGENIRKQLHIDLDKEVYVKTFEQWKESVLQMQKDVDMLLIVNNAGIKGWDQTEAEEFVLKKNTLPTGTMNEWMIATALIGLLKSPEEQGEWSAQTALQILNGEKPSEISLVKNKRGTFVLNFILADALDIIFSPALIRQAEIYDEGAE